MAVSDRDHTRIRQYLLGHLNDEELEKLEERLVLEDDLSEELEISKGELTEQYCSGELTQKESHWFGTHYLATSQGRYEHELALALECLDSPSPEPKKQLTFREKLKSLFKTRSWALAAASALGLVVIASLYFYPRSFNQPVYSITLTKTTLTRDNQNNTPLPEKVTLPSNTSYLRASLKLPDQFPSGTRFEAILDNRIDRKPVNVVEENQDIVTVSIPASELPRGEYALELTAIRIDGVKEEIPGSYRFSVR